MGWEIFNSIEWWFKSNEFRKGYEEGYNQAEQDLIDEMKKIIKRMGRKNTTTTVELEIIPPSKLK